MIVNGIDKKDISVVVQGAIDKEWTPLCLKSIRKYLPESEIILSTWGGSDVENLDYDILVLNKDPGPNELIRKYPHKQVNNIDRQIISSYNGLKKGNRKFGLKIRSDMLLNGIGFLHYYSKYGNDGIENAFFNQRILFGDKGVFIPPYIICDWYSFGLLKDLQEWYNISLYKIKLGEEYFLDEINYYKRPKFADIICQYIPEQWLVIQNILKYDNDINYKHFYDNNEISIKKSIYFIINNTIILEEHLSNVILPKYSNKNNPYTNKYDISFLKMVNLCLKNNIKLKNINFINKIFLKLRYYYIDLYYNNFWHLKNYIYIVSNYIKYDYAKTNNYVEKLKKEEITFIIYNDNNLHMNLKNCILSIKKHFAKSKIILCISEDKIFEFKGLYDNIVSIDINLNLSSYNKKSIYINKALELTNTKYVIKCSSDIIFDSDKLIKFYPKYANIFNKYDINYRLFKQRILILSYNTIDSRNTIEFINTYSFSDILQFGLTEDIKKLYGRNIIQNEYINNNYNDSQISILNLIKKSNKNGINFPDSWNDNKKDEYVFDSEKILASNYLIEDANKLAIKLNQSTQNNNFISFDRFIEIYLLNIDPKNERLLKILEKLRKPKISLFKVESLEDRKIINLFGVRITLKNK